MQATHPTACCSGRPDLVSVEYGMFEGMYIYIYKIFFFEMQKPFNKQISSLCKSKTIQVTNTNKSGTGLGMVVSYLVNYFVKPLAKSFLKSLVVSSLINLFRILLRALLALF